MTCLHQMRLRRLRAIHRPRRAFGQSTAKRKKGMGKKTASLEPTRENSRAESMPVLPSEVDVLQRRSFWLGVVTVVLLFAYTTVSTFQWRAMLKANKNAAKALQTMERPYVPWEIATAGLAIS